MIDSLNKAKEIRNIVKSELEHIPRGLRGSNQNYLRSFYSSIRQHALGRKGNQESKEETLLKCIDLIKKDDQNFEPKYDKTFFKV